MIRPFRLEPVLLLPSINKTLGTDLKAPYVDELSNTCRLLPAVLDTHQWTRTELYNNTEDKLWVVAVLLVAYG